MPTDATASSPGLTVIGDLEELLAAGRTLATLAEPGRDLDALGSDILEIAETLKEVGTRMQIAQERAEEMRDAAHERVGRAWIDPRTMQPWTHDDVALAYDTDLKREREKSQRTAKLALVSLQALVCEMGAP